MAEWKSANLAALLPPGTETIIDTIEGLVTVVKTPLDIVSAILNTAKSLVLSFSLFDFLGTLGDLIEDWKDDFLGSGFFVCAMWDYPVRQLLGGVGTSRDYGPDSTFEKINLDGHEFETSFLADLDSSFDDTKDPYRPQFQSSCSILVLVRAGSSPEDIGITPEEDNAGDVWGGQDSTIGNSGKQVRRVRMLAMLAKLKEAAQGSPVDRVQVRVDRVEQAIQMFGQMTEDEIDALAYPEDEDDGSLYFENKLSTELDWRDDVTPFLESMEGQYYPSTYPDWSRVALADLHPDLVRLANELFDPIVELLQGGSTLKQQLIDMIDAIQAKVDYLQDIIDKIDGLIEDLERLLNATGYHALYISTSKGISDLRAKLRTATNVPFEGKFFYSGMAILAGSDAKTAFDALFAAVAS